MNLTHRFSTWSCCLGLVILASACTETSKAKSPDLNKYKEDTALMLNVAKKFIDEPNAQKLHEVAVATQISRAMACIDFNQECTLYGELINIVITASADGVVSPIERQEMNQKLASLQLSISDGINKLKK